MSDEEVLKIVDRVHQNLREGARSVHKWFWIAVGSALGSAMTAVLTKLVAVTIDRYIK